MPGQAEDIVAIGNIPLKSTQGSALTIKDVADIENGQGYTTVLRLKMAAKWS